MLSVVYQIETIMINRTIQPSLEPITKVEFVAPKSIALSEKCSLFHMASVPNETSRFDLYFDAGKCRSIGGLASFVNGMLLSGTDQKTSIEINESINQLGGFYESGVSLENSVITIYCLKEHLTALLEIVLNALQHVNFDQKELEELREDRKQQLSIKGEKVGFLAQRAFQQKLFGEDQAYAHPTSADDLDKITRDECIEFHKENYLSGLTRAVIVADISEDEINHCVKLLKPLSINDERSFAPQLNNSPGFEKITKKDALQTAIRVGKTIFNKNHEDYLDFLVLNTILGDYFGSRLMSNIREDKGYTYGIGSMLSELNNFGYFLIATEVGADVAENAIQEIKFEIQRLQNELVSDEELSLVKNYMLGQLLKSADGPYAMTDLFLSAELHDKDMNFYNDALAKIQAITPQRIQELAKKHLPWDELSIVTAG